MDEELALEIRGLTKYYDEKVCALDDIALAVRQGEWLAIMGSSGSGKTTFLNIISGLDRPTRGEVLINGTDITGLSTDELTRFRRENIGMVFQQFYLIPYLNALENVMLAQYFHSMADEVEARQALEVVGLTDRIYHLPSQLSGGEKQRVCLARALINSPRLLLADEPTGNLDHTNETMVLRLFQEHHQNGHTIIMVTHNPEVAQMADRIVYFTHGQITSDSHAHVLG
ncbi:MAG: ABC transporter ATP-binding protein, partial [Dehalococcoidales bacterium]|nr:ABC transporter ATP-binding protein [Dehalococcoidales bacterium]